MVTSMQIKIKKNKASFLQDLKKQLKPIKDKMSIGEIISKPGA
jgi:hypothetical protein